MRVIISDILMYYKVNMNGKDVETYKANIHTEKGNESVTYICRHYQEPKIRIGDIVEHGKVVGRLVPNREIHAEQIALF